MINTLGEFDITYPKELDRRDEVIDHVTTLSSHRRRRRSLTEEAGPIIYQVSLVQTIGKSCFSFSCDSRLITLRPSKLQAHFKIFFDKDTIPSTMSTKKGVPGKLVR